MHGLRTKQNQTACIVSTKSNHSTFSNHGFKPQPLSIICPRATGQANRSHGHQWHHYTDTNLCYTGQAPTPHQKDHRLLCSIVDVDKQH
jgi:hypothetical protein